MFREQQKIGNYVLLRKLAKGGFGEVWLAEKQSEFVTKKFAIKLPLDELVDFEAIRHEATLWEQASGHPNVLPLIDADVYDGQVAIISEYAEDGSLADKLKKEGKLSISGAIEMTVGILNGLSFLHSKKIIHRDIKPQNILLQGDTPRLTDFGISRVIHTSAISSVVVGTESYMAPESFEGVRNIQTDLWSVGVLLYRLVSGHLPFPQKQSMEIMYAVVMKEPEPLPADIPPRLQEIIFKALEKDRDLGDEQPPRRYQSAAEMREDLLNFLEYYSQSLLLPEAVNLFPKPSSQQDEPTRVKMHIPLQSASWRRTIVVPVAIAAILGLFGIFWLLLKPAVQTTAANSNTVNSAKTNSTLNSAVKTNSLPTDPEVLKHSDQAYKLYEQRKYDQAIREYSRAIEISPNDFALYNDRGLVYHIKRNFDKAIADFDRSLELNPTSLTYNNRGVAYEDKGDIPNALADYRKALEIDPANETAAKNLKKLDGAQQ